MNPSRHGLSTRTELGVPRPGSTRITPALVAMKAAVSMGAVANSRKCKQGAAARSLGATHQANAATGHALLPEALPRSCLAGPSGDPARLIGSAGGARGYCELGAAKEAEADWRETKYLQNESKQQLLATSCCTIRTQRPPTICIQRCVSPGRPTAWHGQG